MLSADVEEDRQGRTLLQMAGSLSESLMLGVHLLADTPRLLPFRSSRVSSMVSETASLSSSAASTSEVSSSTEVAGKPILGVTGEFMPLQ